MRSTAKVLMSIRCPAFVIFICLANAALADTLKERLIITSGPYRR